MPLMKEYEGASNVMGIKLKEMRDLIISWNQETFGVVEKRLKAEYDIIKELPKKEETRILDEERLERRTTKERVNDEQLMEEIK